MSEETRVCNRCDRSLPRAMFDSRRLHCNKCHSLRKIYGTTYHEVKELWEKQGGACALCEATLSIEATSAARPDTANLDHCHDTGDIRGLLCRSCNLLLGHAKDRIVVLQAAIRYLRKSAEQE